MMGTTAKRLAAACLLLPLTTSCFTSAVWGTRLYDEGEYPSEVAENAIFGDSVPLMILATPFSVALDICTFSVQAILFGWDDED